MGNYDPVTLEEELTERLETAVVQAVEWAGRHTAGLNGVTPQQAQSDIALMVKAWAAGLRVGLVTPSLKSCGG